MGDYKIIVIGDFVIALGDKMSLARQPVPRKIIGDLNGTGNFRSAQAAVNSSPDSSAFIRCTGAASIWHNGSVIKDSKTVLVKCRFGGFDEFKPGRYHRDAQFY